MIQINSEYPEKLLKELASLKNNEHGTLAYGEIKDYNFVAWRHDIRGISSKLIIYPPSRGFLEGKTVEIEGLEFQSNHDFIREEYFHQFVKTNYKDDREFLELSGHHENFMHNGDNKVQSYEDKKKDFENILLFLGKGSRSNISSYWVPKNKEFIELKQLEGSLYGSSSTGTIHEIISAYAEIGLSRVEKRIKGQIK
ncbi:MAG: hypothetical protein KC516_02810 [Nanoarchaeota archaeon]|nr:hypothetical protein [Nanoarchaeota archaeon]